MNTAHEPDGPELVVPLPADVDAFAARRPRVGDLTPEQREALAALAADGDRLTALAEAVTPLVTKLIEFVDGIVASLRAAGLDVDASPDTYLVGLPDEHDAALVVARSDEFDPPLTTAQAVRAQQAINDALTHDRASREGGAS